MKYLRWLSVLVFKIFNKMYFYIPVLLLILSVFNVVSFSTFLISTIIYVHLAIAYIFRKYSRNTVYNYILQNNLYLPRLTNNSRINVTKVHNGWRLKSKRAGEGFIKFKDVSKLEFYLVLFLLWGWVDDDCVYDTTPEGYGPDILKGEHFPNAPKLFLSMIKKEQDYIETKRLGNSFELGDERTSVWVPLLSTLWMIRNLAYNFNYLFEECHPDSKLWFYKDFTEKGWHFGYLPKTKVDGSIQDRMGRMVWFTEDYDKR